MRRFHVGISVPTLMFRTLVKYQIHIHKYPSEKHVVAKPVVDPPLHIKLGLMKNFVKAMNLEGQAFKYLRETFPRLSDAKFIFVGPQIRQLVKDPAFNLVLEWREKEAWEIYNFEL